MKGLNSAISIFGVAAFAFISNAGCGDNTVECGDGTVETNGQCLPESTCGPGTVESGTQCVPDGSMICEQGTVFDPATQHCVVDPSACAEGTVFVDGECIPEDETLEGMADHQEAAEPNGPGEANIAGMFDVPALDQSETFYGCVTARVDEDGDGNLDWDLDTWLVTADGPTTIEITADGIRGLSAGFYAQNADPALSPILDNWLRFGINLTGDTAHRQIYLPAAGTYAFNMTDGRSLFLGGAGAGTEETCYFATIRRIPNPTPVAATLPLTAATDRGEVAFYTYTADAQGDIIDITQLTESGAMSPAFVTLRNGVLQGSSAVAGTTPALNTVGGLSPGDVVTFVIDSEYNYGVSPQPYELEFFDISALALPTTGTMVTVPERNGTSAAGFADLGYLYFDVATAGIKHFNLVSSKPIDMVIVRRDVFTPAGAFDYVAQIDAFGATTTRTTFQNEFVRFLTPGRYYFVAQNPTAVAPLGNYTITATLTDFAINPITFGTPATNQALTLGNRFHSVDLNDPIWIEEGITATTDWGTTTVTLDNYDLAAGGWLRTGTAPTGTLPAGHTYPIFSAAQPAVAPFVPFGRIMPRETRDLLVRVRPTGTGTAGAMPQYSLLVQNRQGFTNLNTIPVGAPVTNNVTGLAPGAPRRFIAFGTGGNTLRVLAHPSSALADIRMVRVNASEGTVATFNSTLVGGDETLLGGFGAAPNDWIAWTVENQTPATTTDVALTITSSLPRPYAITTATIAFDDACTGAGATSLGTGLDDEIFTAQTLPASFAGFQLFGDAVPTNHRVAANGWLSWDTGTVSLGGYQNRQIPTAGPPDGVIAPFWQDMEDLQLCREIDLVTVPNTVTYQWSGHVWGLDAQIVQYQVRLHANGRIDFIYGPNHVANGATADTDTNGATVGAENLTGTFGHQIVYNAAQVTPNSARTLTPM